MPRKTPHRTKRTKPGDKRLDDPPTRDDVNEVAPVIPVKAIATLVHLAESQIVAVDEAVASMDEKDEKAKKAAEAGAHLAGSLRQAIDEVATFLKVYQAWWDVQKQHASPIIKPR